MRVLRALPGLLCRRRRALRRRKRLSEHAELLLRSGLRSPRLGGGLLQLGVQLVALGAHALELERLLSQGGLGVVSTARRRSDALAQRGILLERPAQRGLKRAAAHALPVAEGAL